MNNIIYYITNVTVALFFIMFGVLCMLIPLLSPLRTLFVETVQERSVIIFLVGIIFSLLGMAYASYILINAKKRTYHIRKGKHLIDIDQKVIDTYIVNYLTHCFPNMDISHELIIKKKKIMISADLPYVPESEQPTLTEKIYEDISDILSEKIGYRGELYLSVSFQSPPDKVDPIPK